MWCILFDKKGFSIRLMMPSLMTIVLWAGWAVTTSADVPHLIRYQGQAVNSQGVPLEGAHTLTFLLYDAEKEGAVVWQETQAGVVVTHGYFSVLLGSVKPFKDANQKDIDWTKPLWLAVKVNEQPELQPRQRITSVPLAIDSDTVDGKHASELASRANHTGAQAPSTISPQGSGSNLDADTVDGKQAADLLNRANHTGTQPASTIDGTFPPSKVSPQGSGSGLDADTVDGMHADQLRATSVCAVANEGETISASCPSGKVFRVVNAYYACTQSGSCPDPEIGEVGGSQCSTALNCVGNNSCSFGVGNGPCGGDPCGGTRKRLFLFGICL